ncbi:hypothetical protein OAD54_01445 [Candidatus Pelagibacter sp.]|nr:hypothetical protein [Candidatus Pelagibacter sp.]
MGLATKVLLKVASRRIKTANVKPKKIPKMSQADAKRALKQLPNAKKVTNLKTGKPMTPAQRRALMKAVRASAKARRKR